MVRNGGTSDEKKFLGITFHDIRILDVQYVWVGRKEKISVR